MDGYIDEIERKFPYWDKGIPIGATPGYVTSDKICPVSKKRRGKGLNFQEDSEFSGICKFGSWQLISCYGNRVNEDWFSKYDFYEMCRDCQYSFIKSKGYRNGYGTQYSICRHEFIDVFFEEYIDLCSENPRWFVYFISDGNYIKIGKADNPYKRLKALQTGNPNKLSIFYTIPAKSEESAYKIENTLHRVYSNYRMEGEWFDILKFLDKKSFFDCRNEEYFRKDSKNEENSNII